MDLTRRLFAGGNFAGSATLREPQHADSFLRSRGPRRYEFGCAGWTILLRQRALAKGIVRVDLAKTPSPLLRRKDMGARVPRITREHRPIQFRSFAFYHTAVVKSSRCQIGLGSSVSEDGYLTRAASVGYGGNQKYSARKSQNLTTYGSRLWAHGDRARLRVKPRIYWPQMTDEHG